MPHDRSGIAERALVDAVCTTRVIAYPVPGTVEVPGEPALGPVAVHIAGDEFELPLAVAAEIGRLRDATRGAAVIVGEAMRLRDEGLDLVDELLSTLKDKGRLSQWQASAWRVRGELLIEQRRVARARRTDGRG